MSDSFNISSILGYVLFAASELLPLLPIPANGFLHSVSIGLFNSFKKSQSTDLEVAQNLLVSRPNMPNIVNTLEGNQKLIDSIGLLNDNPQLLLLLNKLSKDKNLQFINTLLVNNPDMINDIKKLVLNTINSFQQQNTTQNEVLSSPINIQVDSLQ